MIIKLEQVRRHRFKIFLIYFCCLLIAFVGFAIDWAGNYYDKKWIQYIGFFLDAAAVLTGAALFFYFAFLTIVVFVLWIKELFKETSEFIKSKFKK